MLCYPQERYWFCMAPANLRNPVAAAALARFAARYAARQPVTADVAFRERPPLTSDELCDLEAAHQVRCSPLAHSGFRGEQVGSAKSQVLLVVKTLHALQFG